MKYFHLIWAALFRRKTRTIFTMLSVLAAFLLFGLLNSVRVAFTSGSRSVAGVDRLVVTSRYSIIQGLPQGLLQQIAAIPGVKLVDHANWFGGIYQDPKNFVLSFAVGPHYIDLFPEIELPAEQRQAWDADRTGAVVGEALAARYHWKIGDKIPLQSTIFPQKNGDKTWPFEIVGIFKENKNGANGLDQVFFFHWKYFEEANGFSGHDVGWYVLKLADPKQADRVAHAIDAISANSDHETKTQTESAFNASFAKQIGDIGLIVGAIMAAVFFTLILLTGNTMAQAVRERIPELAVLKTIGFTGRGVLALVLGESVLLLLIGGVIGMGLAAVVAPGVSKGSGGMVQLPPVGAGNWLQAVIVMIVIGIAVGVLPALRAMRLKIVDALAGR